MIVRCAEEKELEVCASVIREAFLTVAKEFGFTKENAPRFTAFAISKERLRGQMAEGRTLLLAEENGVLCGFASVHLTEETKAELNNLAVLPDFRHLGIGKALVERVISKARELGAEQLDISIVEENERLKNWYQSLGFVHTGTQKLDFFPFTCGYLSLKL